MGVSGAARRGTDDCDADADGGAGRSARRSEGSSSQEIRFGHGRNIPNLHPVKTNSGTVNLDLSRFDCSEPETAQLALRSRLAKQRTGTAWNGRLRSSFSSPSSILDSPPG